MLHQPLRLRGFFVMGASVAALTAAAAPAMAQDTAFTIEELVVTAEKREQSLQDVPVAVTAYTSEKRDLLGVATVEDLARITPSVAYTNNDRLSIRGFGRLTNAIGTDPSVALYSDGIFSNSMADSSTPSLFIERTEILRGPQGTLYGRNSIGGALNIIGKRPSDEFNGEVRAAVGNYGSWRTDALVTGPVTDGLRFLLGGSLERRDKGFIKNVGPAGDTSGVERYVIEAQIEADLGENITARLRYTKFDWDDSYGVGNVHEAVISPYDTVSVTGLGNAALYYNPTFGYGTSNISNSDEFKIDTNQTMEGKLSNHNRLHFDLTWDLGDISVKYLAGYQAYVYNTNGDEDRSSRTGNFSINAATPFGAYTATNVSPNERFFYQEKQKWWSNEINISSNTDDPLQWIVGAFQYHQVYSQPQGLRVLGDPSMLSPINLATGGLAAPNPNGNFLLVDGTLEVDSFAAFGQIDYAFTDTLTLTAGLRWTKDEKTGTDFARYVSRTNTTTTILRSVGIPLTAAQGMAVDFTTFVVCGGPTIATCAANPLYSNLRQDPNGGLVRDLAADYDAWTGTLGLQWQPDDDTNAYARYSRGYKSGGWLASNGLTPFPYADPEYVDNYELGLKKTFGGRFQLNAAVFYADYKGFQAPLTVVLNATTGSTGSQFLNLDARNYGFELETQWAPLDNLSIFGSYSYINAEIEEGCCFVDANDPRALQPGAKPIGAALPNGSQPQTLVGNRLPMTSEHKLNLGANYTFDFAAGSLTLGGTYTYTDDMQTTVFSQPNSTAPSNEIVDFRALWKDGDSRFTIIGYVKNAFDETAYQSSTTSSVTAANTFRRTVKLNFPRTFGVEFQYRF
ncbi:TonB-dependent receptor [Phenylobacterium sp.]|uniref:TonB-dependent receptor n=1 Tax=Phenylobacterium sp. TaxID=1871053 RepID=UPI002734E6BC|nr:TonB-dependent receptor [Phenylobacterium sp.]